MVQATVYRKAVVLGTEVLFSLFVFVFVLWLLKAAYGKWGNRRPGVSGRLQELK